MWLALNLEKDIPRKEIRKSYTHIAFSIEEAEFDNIYNKLGKLGVNILTGRPRDERDKKSIYFTDPDGHKFEFHTRSEEHTSELQSRGHLVCRLLLEKNKYEYKDVY